ncbi:hypothetical protein DVH05_020352 [Phytophthora capsici]|nr:hypothetical protein DVH05_020352 [Phytophthora capsici]
MLTGESKTIHKGIGDRNVYGLFHMNVTGIVKVVRGSSVPTDGVIVYGEGRLDESMLTGESKTIHKGIGDRNVYGLFHMNVTGIDSETALSQIIRLVETAQKSKAPIQEYADYISSLFVPTVLGLSIVTFVVWYVLCELNVVRVPDSDGKFVFALDFAIATLVVACPCALGLATPTAVMVGTGGRSMPSAIRKVARMSFHDIR